MRRCYTYTTTTTTYGWEDFTRTVIGTIPSPGQQYTCFSYFTFMDSKIWGGLLDIWGKIQGIDEWHQLGIVCWFIKTFLIVDEVQVWRLWWWVFFLFTFLSFGRLLLLKLGRCSIQMESASLHIMVFGRVCRLLRGWPRLGDCVTKTWWKGGRTWNLC